MASNDVQKLYALIGENQIGIETATTLRLGLKALLADYQADREKAFNETHKELDRLNNILKGRDLTNLQKRIDKRAKQSNDALYAANQANKKIAVQDKKIAEIEKKITAYNKRLDSSEKKL